MQASAEELLLLLKKWEGDKTVVSAVGSTKPPDGFRVLFKVSGLVSVDWAAAVFSIGSVGENVVICHIPYRGVSYLQREEMDDSIIKRMMVDPDEVEEVIYMGNADASTLLLFTLKPN